MKETIVSKEFGGERPLFGSKDLILKKVIIHAGESALKECDNIEAEDCIFEGKYPFWHVRGAKIKNCLFKTGARAAIWYTRDVEMSDCMIEAPKMFREINGLKIKNVLFPDAQETLWHCSDVEIKDVKLDNADYLFMHGKDIEISRYVQNGNYSFQYCRNVKIENAVINSKDAFWNCDNVIIRDSEIHGEYLGWYSKNLTFINCRISGTQPLCYIENLRMENCILDHDCDLAFEDSCIEATIRGEITSIKNPRTGHIKCDKVNEIIIDSHLRAPGDCLIEQTKA